MTLILARGAEVRFALRAPEQDAARETSAAKVIAAHGCASDHAGGADSKALPLLQQRGACQWTFVSHCPGMVIAIVCQTLEQTHRYKAGQHARVCFSNVAMDDTK
jgi:hypothetical protein